MVGADKGRASATGEAAVLRETCDHPRPNQIGSDHSAECSEHFGSEHCHFALPDSPCGLVPYKTEAFCQAQTTMTSPMQKPRLKKLRPLKLSPAEFGHFHGVPGERLWS